MRQIVLALLTALTLSPAFAADPPTTNDPAMMEAMKAWEKFATPGDAHKVFAPLAGNWKYTSKWWPAANAPAQESKGTSTIKLMFGKRFLRQEVKGTAMGKPFEGFGLLGFDNAKGKYESVWLDNMGTGIVHATGTYDTGTKTLKDSGEYSDPTAPNQTRAYRAEWTITDDNHNTYTMWTTGKDGKEYKQMEMAYQRTK